MIKLTAFRSVPPFAQGLVRDVRVRWALEEAGIPYQEWLIGPEDRATAAYRALQPFGQVPAIETDELKLFESGAIVLHIAERSETLMPSDPNGRARGGAEPAWRNRGLARRARLPRGPVHGRGSPDDHCAAHPAPYRTRVRAAGA